MDMINIDINEYDYECEWVICSVAAFGVGCSWCLDLSRKTFEQMF